MTNVAAERDAFEAWYAQRHPKPTHENSTWAHCAKMDDWEVWQARAGAAPAAVAPLPSVLEQIAQGWDGCKYDAPGETLDIGADIRSAAARLLAEQAAAVAGPAHWEADDDSRPRSRADLARVLDEWNDTTGCIPRMSSWRVEVLSIIEDAFDLGMFLGEKAHLAPALEAPAAPESAPWCPDACPITGRPFFMWITHHETGVKVPTYGGPFDSYTLPVKGSDGSFECERYDHDRGGWLTDEIQDVGLKLVDDQSFIVAPDHPRYTEVEEFANGAATFAAAKPGSMIAVPFDLIASACSAIDKKRDAPKTLAELRRYTTGDLSCAALAAAPQAPAAPVGEYTLVDEGGPVELAGAQAQYSIERADGSTAAWILGDGSAVAELMAALRMPVSGHCAAAPAAPAVDAPALGEWVATLEVDSEGGLDYETVPPCTLPPGCYRLYRAAQAKEGGEA